MGHAPSYARSDGLSSLRDLVPLFSSYPGLRPGLFIGPPLRGLSVVASSARFDS